MTTPKSKRHSPTYREAIQQAQRRVQAAEEALKRALSDRNDLLREAANRGASLRALGEVVGISTAGVHRAVGHKGSTNSETALDSELVPGIDASGRLP